MGRATTSVPLFCPTCGKTESDAGLQSCSRCGDRLTPQGYCAVCEGFVPRRPGQACPKHELILESDAPPTPFAGPVEGSWIEVARFPDSLDCQPLRIRLEGEGIPTQIDGERMGSRSMYQVATGGARLSVPESLAADARVILSQTWSQDAEALGIEDDDWDDFGDDGLDGRGGDKHVLIQWAPYLVAVNVAALAIVVALAGYELLKVLTR